MGFECEELVELTPRLETSTFTSITINTNVGVGSHGTVVAAAFGDAS